MDNQNIGSNPQPNKLPNWPVLFLRWLLGALVAIVISASFYFALLNHNFSGPFLWVLEKLPVLAAPFVGHIYLFYPPRDSFLSVYSLFVTIPVLSWGLVGAMLASVRKSQIRIGIILFVLFVLVGYVSFFLGALRVPT
jgi:hypothetical protein